MTRNRVMKLQHDWCSRRKRRRCGIPQSQSASSSLWIGLLWSLLLSGGKRILVESVHPHPHVEESVRIYHRSLKQRQKLSNFSNSSSPSTHLINSALCSDVSHEHCISLEENMQKNARSLQGLTRQTGFVRILVLLIRFRDHTDRQLPAKEVYTELFNGDIESDVIPSGSIEQFLNANSYGQLRIEAEVIDWTMTDQTEHHYSFGRSGLTTRFRKSVYPVLDQLESEGFDFGRFDVNGDGILDSVVMLHSGYAAEIGGKDCETGANTKHRIWAHAITETDSWESPSTGIRLSGYSVSSGLRERCHLKPARISVICHEFLHTLGLPDLNDGAGDWIGRGLGEYDIMSNAHDLHGAQINPAFLSPWSKLQLGWINPIEIVDDGVYAIEASELKDQVYIVSKPFPEGEYLMVENRQPILWDRLLWSGGLLIWHVDSKKKDKHRLKHRGYPGMPGWPGNDKHYGIALAAADGRYDIETGDNGGDDGDYWKDDSIFGPGPTEKVATDNGIYPNTNSYRGGKIQRTGLILDEFSASETTMYFRVRGLPISIPQATPISSPQAAPISPPQASPISFPQATPTPKKTLQPTPSPTSKPTRFPTPDPTSRPTSNPTPRPTPDPTRKPTPDPTRKPTPEPTLYPTPDPTFPPTPPPSTVPTPEPTTAAPTLLPSFTPSEDTSTAPTKRPSLSPTWNPSLTPTEVSTEEKSLYPTSVPSTPFPSMIQSFRPSTVVEKNIVYIQAPPYWTSGNLGNQMHTAAPTPSNQIDQYIVAHSSAIALSANFFAFTIAAIWFIVM